MDGCVHCVCMHDGCCRYTRVSKNFCNYCKYFMCEKHLSRTICGKQICQSCNHAEECDLCFDLVYKKYFTTIALLQIPGLPFCLIQNILQYI